MGGFYSLGLMFILVGAAGFTRRGLPFTSKKRLKGRRGRTVGGLCVAFGLLGIAVACWAGTPEERRHFRTLTLGIVLGVGGTLVVIRGSG
jgi:drug/metabolite transporter (DMT)-like permease